jgi:hypothetical protein
MLDIRQCYKRKDTIAIRKVGDKQWALDTENGSEYAINNTVYDLLDMLSEPLTVADITNKMVASYDVSKTVFLEDLDNWLLLALKKGLVSYDFYERR